MRPTPDLPPLAVSNDLRGVEPRLALWASTAVLKHFVAYRRMDPQISPNDPVKRAVIEKMMREMRRDLGQYSLGLGDNDLTDLLL